jgi:hypothetical protein
VSRVIWWAALGLIAAAAAGMTSWSLYTVAHDIYNVPRDLATLTAAVFDGTAIACLYLANQAVRERRSALGPHAATLAMAGISVYLNRLHALRIHGGLGATLLFAAPTVALLALCGLAWSATRARLRTADGDRPVALRHYGFWGWMLAGHQAWQATKARAVAHVTSPDGLRIPSGSRPPKPHSATERLRQHFADLDPADAIRTAASARPDATPAELAEELGIYGVHVTPVAVALVLGQQPPSVRLDRADRSGPDPGPIPPGQEPMPLTGPDGHPDVPGYRPESIFDAVRHLASQGVTEPEAVATEASRLLGRQVKQETVRRYLASLPRRDEGVGKGGGGYA